VCVAEMLVDWVGNEKGLCIYMCVCVCVGGGRGLD